MTNATVEDQSLLVQLLDPSSRANPYPLYHQIRERGPIVVPESNLVVFADFATCDAVLRHPSSANDGSKSTAAQRQVALGQRVRPEGPPGFLFLDPPDHTRLRGLVSKAFVPRVVRELEPNVVEMVDGLLDAVAGCGEFDVVAALARPLPVAVICRLLGVPLEDEPEFSQASALLAEALDPFLTITGQPSDGADERLAAGRWMRGYLRELITRRRRSPRDDLISGLIAAEEGGDQLTEAEIVATCNLLLIAGHETTVNLIANAVLALLREPRQWAALSADPARVASVVEETMRYDPPVHVSFRIAGDDMSVGGVDVPKGDSMLLLVAAADRDPAHVDRPDVFDPDRGGIRHLGFGKGPHFCLGAPLARLEAAVALSAVAARFPDARLLDEPVYKPNLTLRGMATLRVAV